MTKPHFSAILKFDRQIYNDLPNSVTIFKFKISRNWDEISWIKFEFATFIVNQLQSFVICD
jgi:hypothetical protein